MDHFYKDVPGWAAFDRLYFEVAEHSGLMKDGAVFVEVGSWLGRSAALMGTLIENSGKKVVLHCVDPWIDGGPDLRDTNHYRRVADRPLVTQFLENVRPVIQHIAPVQKMSVEAAADFADGSVDFLMLDGDHSYEAVRDDIAAWTPKMKPGGIISGDDYGWPGVTRAVTETYGEKANVVWRYRHENYLKSASYWWVLL